MGRRCSARPPWLAGNWSLDTTLAAGTYNNLKVTVTDLAGNASTTTNAQTIIVDATPPSGGGDGDGAERRHRHRRRLHHQRGGADGERQLHAARWVRARRSR